MLSIRHVVAADIPLIQQLAMQVWPQTYTPILGEAQVAYMLGLFYSRAALLQQLQQHSFIMVYDDDAPVAFASWSGAGTGIYKLHKIYIIPGVQGRGIGRHIISYIAADVKARQGAALRLNVNIYNHPAIAFYEKTGFTQYGKEDIDIGNGYYMNDYIFSLDL